MEVESAPAAVGDIDEALYSRQLYVIGHEAMRKMTSTNVIILGCKGISAEIAKNIILSGVKSVTLQDEKVAQWSDLSAHFYLSEADIGKNRAAACVDKMAELNPYVKVTAHTEKLTQDFLANYQVVVCTDTRLAEALEINKFCHERNIAFIYVDNRGVCASIFVDNGTNFEVHDKDGEPTISCMVSGISKENAGLVTVTDDTRHGLEDGDYVTFTEVQGMTELNDSPARPIKVLGPYTFTIEDTTGYGDYARGGYVQSVKQVTTVNFDSMADSIDSPEFLMFDFLNFSRPTQLHAGFRALHAFADNHGGVFPRPGNDADAAEVVGLAKEIDAQTSKLGEDFDEKTIHKFVRHSNGEISPMSAFIGGIAAQEALKACSGKFMPIRQWFYFDCFEVLPDAAVPEADMQPAGCRYDGQITVIGRALTEKISNLKYFLVGAGAIGCEMLKNWALLGLGSGPNGLVQLTDMDTIEKSNLSRQFLFRQWDVQKLKSQTAAAAAKVMNPGLNVQAFETRVGPDTEEQYDDAFFENLDGVCNALDNVEARLYMDTRCVFYQKPLLESGTLGTKGNTQTVVPMVTESYGSSRDPPEKSIPICTLKNFPNKIDHTIQWARDSFEGLFKQAAEDANSYLSNADFLASLGKQIGTRLSTLETVRTMLVASRPVMFDECVVWARLKFEEMYNNNIQQLLFNFPVDMLTSTGTPFWSGPKRAPTPLTFDAEDPTHMQFVIAAANLHAENYGLKGEQDVDYFKRALANVMVPEFAPKSGVKIQVTENENAGNDGGDEDEDRCDTIMQELPPPSSLAGYRLSPVEFEKDDDTNHHIDFITSCSNLRARNYNITEADKHTTKGIAGKIIPAIATTTALVTGLVCMELMKIMQNKPIDQYKNGFANLALPLFSFAEPIPPVKKPLGEWNWSLWDRIDVNEGDITLQQFIDYFKGKFGIKVTMISYGVSILYNAWIPSAKMKERLTMKVVDVARTVSKTEFLPKQQYLVMEVCCLDMEDEDVDTPYVRFKMAAR